MLEFLHYLLMSENHAMYCCQGAWVFAGSASADTTLALELCVKKAMIGNLRHPSWLCMFLVLSILLAKLQCLNCTWCWKAVFGGEVKLLLPSKHVILTLHITVFIGRHIANCFICLKVFLEVLTLHIHYFVLFSTILTLWKNKSRLFWLKQQ